jgi:hypothetical protein
MPFARLLACCSLRARIRRRAASWKSFCMPLATTCDTGAAERCVICATSFSNPGSCLIAYSISGLMCLGMADATCRSSSPTLNRKFSPDIITQITNAAEIFTRTSAFDDGNAVACLRSQSIEMERRGKGQGARDRHTRVLVMMITRTHTHTPTHTDPSIDRKHYRICVLIIHYTAPHVRHR